jgi:outer membrane lipopolysaccharide assembly protein LptE/RlpB
VSTGSSRHASAAPRGLGWRRGLLVVLLAAVTGCGYQLSGHAGPAPANLRQISVPMFSNTTAVPGLERLFTAAVREQFLRDGRVRVATDAGAPVLLRGEVRRYHLQVLATDRADFAVEYRAESEMHITVEDRRQGQIMLDQPLVVTAEYVLSERVVPNDIARERALQNMAREAGERIVSLVLDRF